MKTIELKEKLKERINEIDDNSLLQDLYNLVQKDLEAYKLSEPQKLRIRKARQEIKEGKTISNETAKAKARGWFKKK